jgi:hypothetical protein
VARWTARIERLEALHGVHAGDELAHLSDAELHARLGEAIGRLAAVMHKMLLDGMSVADIEAETGRSADEPWFAALLAEAQAPEFDLERYFAAMGWPPPEDK